MQALRHGPAAGGGWGGVAGVGPTTVDEASMERSKSFIKALQVLREPCISRSHMLPPKMIFLFPCEAISLLRFSGDPAGFCSLGFCLVLVLDGADFCAQELKNLRPQLYSASEYCEKSYLHSEQKQM